MVTGSLHILVRWRNNFYQFLNTRGYNDVRHTELCTADPLVSNPSAYEFESAAGKTKRHIITSTDQISIELIKAGRRTMF